VGIPGLPPNLSDRGFLDQGAYLETLTGHKRIRYQLNERALIRADRRDLIRPEIRRGNA
jgi:hypothetical protein